MSPTTLIGQKTSTSPFGRSEEHSGKPIKVSEMIATIDGAKYIARVSVDSPANVRKAKKAIMRAFKTQLEGKGFAMVEVLSSCPTNWGMTPIDALKWVRTDLMAYYPLGEYKNWEA